MRHLGASIALLALGGAVAFAHGDNEHVRGVVTAITAKSITIQLQDNKTRTLTLTAKSAFEKSGDPAQIKDLKVGERVVIDVPKGTSEARLIRFGPPKKPTKPSGGA